ncbi:MAG: peptidoglycan-binding domain-containing protein [Crocosphaera sp.]|nr:peptidoglycan-binding domain-containing protein [Crocosphaera sp.]
MIGYRYFWLENPQNTDIDGVGTLLQWWINQNKPCFELKPHQQIEETQNYNKNQDYYQAEIYQSDSFNVYYDNTVENISKEIEKTPHIFRITEDAEKNKFPTYLQVHFLALHLQKEHKRTIAWTWNIGCLEHPNQYTLIGCENQKYFKWNQKYNNVTTPLGQEISLPENQKSVRKTYTNTLKTAIHRIAENRETNKYLGILIDELKDSDSVRHWEWGKLIDETWLENPNKSEISRYKSLVLLLNPNLKTDQIDTTPVSWIESLKPSSDLQKKNQMSPVNQYAENGIKVQDQLFKYSDQDSKIKEQLVPRINQIISELLLNLSKSQDNYQVIEWLFVNSSEFWKDYLVNYGNDLFKNLKNYQQKDTDKEPEEIQDKFLSEIMEDLSQYSEDREEKGQTNPPAKQSKNPLNNKSQPDSQSSSDQKETIKYPNYQPIAEIFEKTKAYSLSAFFYQLSIGEVPSCLKKKCTNIDEIIRLKYSKKDKKETKIGQNTLPNLKNIGLIASGIIIGLLIGIPMQGLFKIYDKILYSLISPNQSEIIPSTHELSLYFYLLKSGYLTKDLDDLIKKIPRSSDENYKNETSRNEIINNREELTSLPLYKFIEEFTPPVNPEISRSYTTDDIKPETLLTSSEIKQVKDFLKGSLGIYKGEINDTWDQKTSDAIKKFQDVYKITPDDGNLGQDTWSIISIMIQDRQVIQAAQKLKSIIEQSKNYEEFKTKFNKLKGCKDIKEQVYSDCLKEEPKKQEKEPQEDETTTTDDA